MSKLRKISKFNYRACFRPSIPGFGYQIHEVFYDEKGRIVAYAKDPVTLHGDDIAELYEDMHRVYKAIEGEEPLDLDRTDKKISLHNL